MNEISVKKHSGLTLVEVLIAMTLGLFLIGGVIQVFLGTKRTYSVVTSQSYAQESGRFALFFITGGLRHAGYWGTLGRARNFQAHDVFNSKNAIVLGGNNDSTDDTVLDGTDHIYIRMTGDADSSVETCLGASLLDTEVAIDHYYVAMTSGSEQIPSLVCSSTVYAFDTTDLSIGAVTTATQTQALVSGIENMQILYGLIGARGGNAEQYVTAAAVTDWRDVRSVRVAVLATSNDDSSGFENTTQYRLLDETFDYDAGGTADRRIRVVFEQTTSLRNFIFKATST